MKKQLFSLLFLILFSVVVSAQAQEAQKIEEFGNVHCEGYLVKIESAVLNALNDQTSKIYILVYEGKLTKAKFDSKGKLTGYEETFPPFGLAKAKIRSMKKYLKVKKLPQENFVFIEAGLLEDFKVEIWLVPNGATPPKPAPTLKKMKYRKGKPSGFCTECC